TFNDLYNERSRRTKQGMFGFVLWIFLETAIGIVRERLLLVSSGEMMRTILTDLGQSTLFGFLLILPLMIMEVVNRRNFNGDFPYGIFFILWFNLFAACLMTLPIVRGRMRRPLDMANSVPAKGTTLLTNPM